MSSSETHDRSTLPARTPDAVVPARPATTERGLEPTDALTHYMAQLAAHAPISREEEHELAVRWREHGDKEAGRQLVLANLRLVVKIAMEYRRAWTNTLDLIQEGNLGLLQALQRFDPSQGVKLSSYGAYWIRAFILKYLIDNIRRCASAAPGRSANFSSASTRRSASSSARVFAPSRRCWPSDSTSASRTW